MVQSSKALFKTEALIPSPPESVDRSLPGSLFPGIVLSQKELHHPRLTPFQRAAYFQRLVEVG